MESLILAQISKSTTFLEEDEKLLRKIDVKYCIPNTLSDRKEIRKWAGYTSLHFAAQIDGMEDLVIELLNRGSNFFKKGIDDRQTPLHRAASKRYIYKKSGRLPKCSMIDTLLSKQVEMNNPLNPECNYGISHLHIACIVNHAKAVKFFAQACVDLDQQIDDELNYLPGYTALHCAIEYSSVQAADILIYHGADVHIENAKGMSCIQLLLKRLIDITDMMKMGKRKLCISFEQEIDRLESIVKLLVKARVTREIFPDDTGLSALHVACTLKDISVVKDILKEVVHVNIPVKSESELWPGWTPLHFAACFNIEIMVLLLEKGGNIIMKNLDGETALDLGTKRFTPADIVLLLSKEKEFKDIVMSDNLTKLLDLLLAMNDYNSFSKFVQKLKNVNIVIPSNSTIWPGSNLLHICLHLNERSKEWKDFEKQYVIPETTDDTPKHYNCTEDDETLYGKRIELCLESGCSVDIKNIDGQSPIHLAFSMFQKVAVEKLLKFSKENATDDNGLSHLFITCALGNLDIVKKYSSEGADLNSRVKVSFDWLDEEWNGSIIKRTMRANSTPLHVAVAFCHRKIVKYLLENNADVYAEDSMGFTSIHQLVYLCPFNVNGIDKLLFDATSNLRDCVNLVNLSHLHIAASTNNEKAVKTLLLNGAEVNRIVDVNAKQLACYRDWAGMTPLLLTGGGCAKILLKAGADMYFKDPEGYSKLHRTVREMCNMACVYFVRLVRKEQCDLDTCGMTALHVASSITDYEWAKKLIKKGADVNAEILDDGGELEGATPLYVLINEKGSYYTRLDIAAVAKLLVDNGADVNIDCNGKTPLHLIYEQNFKDVLTEDDYEEEESERYLDAADILLESITSHDINPIDSQGFSHFHFACIRNDVETAKKFLDHGVDVNAPTDVFAEKNAAFTPLHFAMAYQTKDVAYLLIDRGADVNAEDVRGNKPIHVALKRGFVDFPFFEIMFKHGVDVNAKNINGETLLYCLLGYGGLTLERLEFFLNHGCSINIVNAISDTNEGILGLVMRTAPLEELTQILKRLGQVDEVKSAIENGFNIIQSIVALGEDDDEDNDNYKNELTLDNYLSAIEIAINIGCDIDRQNKKGRTALHTAVSFCNPDAVEALLQLGTDVNVANNEKDGLFSDNFDISEKDDDEDPEMKVIKALACHFWKMRCIDLKIENSNLRCLEKVEEHVSLVKLLEQSCQDELTKAQETEIYQSLTVRDFLSELGAVAEYPRMCSIRRAIVDKFFKDADYLRREFPQFCGLLVMQYRKALARMDLWQPAKEVIALICPNELPDLCLDAILRYFENNEMKLLVEMEKDLLNLFDFSQ